MNQIFFMSFLKSHNQVLKMSTIYNQSLTDKEDWFSYCKHNQNLIVNFSILFSSLAWYVVNAMQPI